MPWEVGEKLRKCVHLGSQGRRCPEQEGIINCEHRGNFISSFSLAGSQLPHRSHLSDPISPSENSKCFVVGT